jgi:hypothetical protein
MADLKWAVAYRFDDEADGYVSTTFNQEMDRKQSQPAEQVTPLAKDNSGSNDQTDSKKCSSNK